MTSAGVFVTLNLIKGGIKIITVESVVLIDGFGEPRGSSKATGPPVFQSNRKIELNRIDWVQIHSLIVSGINDFDGGYFSNRLIKLNQSIRQRVKLATITGE